MRTGARASRPLRAAPTPGTLALGIRPPVAVTTSSVRTWRLELLSVRRAGRGHADSPHSRSQDFTIMRKKENTPSSSTLEVRGRLGPRQGPAQCGRHPLTPPLPQGTKEARGAPGPGDPSFKSCAGSSTSVHSFTDDLGYQGSRELSSVSGFPGARLPWGPTARVRHRPGNVLRPPSRAAPHPSSPRAH